MLESQNEILNLALEVIDSETRAIQSLKSKLNINFVRACQALAYCAGRVVVMGMGKSGHIAKKIAATFASTGTAAFFVHPAEASHGDLGMIRSEDILVLLSHSGETEELLRLLPRLKCLGPTLIGLSTPQSKLASLCDIILDVRVNEEACPMNLAPTSSTTAALVMGDALAICVFQMKGFKAVDFALSHPSGRLGRQLTLRVGDLMHIGSDLPCVPFNTPLSEALIIMNQKRLGLIIALDKNLKAKGLITDGDLRRLLKKEINIHHSIIKDIMNASFQSAPPDLLAIDALKMMQAYQITHLPIIQEHALLGLIHIHDLLKAGIV